MAVKTSNAVAIDATQVNDFFAKLPRWGMAAAIGYEPQTTFWMDFSIADVFGTAAIQDTFNRAFADWKKNHVYLTEMSLVLNHKIWQHHGHNEEFAALYNNLWQQVDEYATANLKDAELSYYYRVTD